MSKEGWRNVKLGDLLTDAQAVEVGKLLARRDGTALRAYLRSIGEQLERKGVLADYLYYVLSSEFEVRR